jgi:hypothetical protein
MGNRDARGREKKKPKKKEIKQQVSNPRRETPVYRPVTPAPAPTPTTGTGGEPKT